MKTLYVTSHAQNNHDIKIDIINKEIPTIQANECLIKIASSGVNPSDALALTGYFKHAKLPRIPGRDFAGTITQGPNEWLGKQVWGTGGDAGIGSDGTQAAYIKLNINDIAEIPNNMDVNTAGAQTLPYVTAYYGLLNRARIKPSETVLIVGALGQVGQAAMSILNWQQCRAIALVRGQAELQTATSLGWNAINSEETHLAEKILAANHGKPVSVILNSVGNLYWQSFLSILDEFGRIVTLSARENTREATINLFDLYRANQELIGINTISLNFAENARILNSLKPGFESNQLKPLKVEAEAVYPFTQATQAYQQILQGSSKRMVIQF